MCVCCVCSCVCSPPAPRPPHACGPRALEKRSLASGGRARAGGRGTPRDCAVPCPSRAGLAVARPHMHIVSGEVWLCARAMFSYCWRYSSASAPGPLRGLSHLGPHPESRVTGASATAAPAAHGPRCAHNLARELRRAPTRRGTSDERRPLWHTHTWQNRSMAPCIVAGLPRLSMSLRGPRPCPTDKP